MIAEEYRQKFLKTHLQGDLVENITRLCSYYLDLMDYKNALIAALLRADPTVDLDRGFLTKEWSAETKEKE